MLLYGVVTSETESVVEFFATREQADRFITEVDADEPETAEQLRMETFEFEQVPN